MRKQAMIKTAAMNKLAQAVSNYVQAEAQFNKIASAIGQFDSGRYQAPQANLQKEAQGILQRLGLKAPPPAAKSNMGRNAALAALLLGGGAAGAYGMSQDGQGTGRIGKLLDAARASGIDIDPVIARSYGNNQGDISRGIYAKIKEQGGLGAPGVSVGDYLRGLGASIGNVETPSWLQSIADTMYGQGSAEPGRKMTRQMDAPQGGGVSDYLRGLRDSIGNVEPPTWLQTAVDAYAGQGSAELGRMATRQMDAPQGGGVSDYLRGLYDSVGNVEPSAWLQSVADTMYGPKEF